MTAETIRRDLTTLERAGVLRRVHGGAIPVERIGFEPALATRDAVLTEEKERIAKAALAEVPEEGAIILDAGTTTARLAQVTAGRPGADRGGELAGDRGRAGSPGANLNVLLLGGRVRGKTLATVDDWALRPLADLYVDVAFLGTNGCSVERGLTTPDPAEAGVKRAMIPAARRRVVLADHTRSATTTWPGSARSPTSICSSPTPGATTSSSRTSRPRASGWSAHDHHADAQSQPGPDGRGRRLVRGEVIRAAPARLDPGGKGVNVSRALLANGVASRAVLPCGGEEGAAARPAAPGRGGRPGGRPDRRTDPLEHHAGRAGRHGDQGERARTDAVGAEVDALTAAALGRPPRPTGWWSAAACRRACRSDVRPAL